MNYGKYNIVDVLSILSKTPSFFEGGHIYLQNDIEYDEIFESTVVYFGEPSEVDDEDEENAPEYVLNLGFDLGFESEHLQNVFQNLFTRGVQIDAKLFAKALRYFLENDSFIQTK